MVGFTLFLFYSIHGNTLLLHVYKPSSAYYIESPCCHFLDDIIGHHEITYVKPIHSVKCDLGSFSFTHSVFLPCSYVCACVHACVRARARVRGAWCVCCVHAHTCGPVFYEGHRAL